MFAIFVDDQCLLVVIFKAGVSVGLVKYYATSACPKVARQMEVARQRDPAVRRPAAAVERAWHL